MDRPVLPFATIDTKSFWDGCLDGQLLLQRCRACSALRHPPSPICPTCLGDAHEWISARGRGTVYTFTVVREARRGWEKFVPYVLAVIALEEGPHILSNIVDIAPEQVAIGMPVEVTFADLGGSTKLPLFRPVTS
ncbi:MAG TPA: Zn-ribbon domain-containing OB-fold protein [Stellaceae bacterium]|jgi:hypothetical protein|nr:Zn-ribbon domain-containing OB-fold protein [Stellaceae bacterium]